MMGVSPTPMHCFVGESTSLASISYVAEQSLLEVEFCDGALYRFFAVPVSCFQELLASDSKGRYFNGNIRNRFRFQRVTDQSKDDTQEN
jgi:lysyl-tRNA synthetase class 2